MSHEALDWRVRRTGPGRRGRPPPWTFPFSACGRLASVNDRQERVPWAPWELALCPSSPGVSPTLHVANCLIMSGCTDWNSTCVQRGRGLGRPARILPSRPWPSRQPFLAWPLLCWAAIEIQRVGKQVKSQPFLEVQSAPGSLW